MAKKKKKKQEKVDPKENTVVLDLADAEIESEEKIDEAPATETVDPAAETTTDSTPVAEEAAAATDVQSLADEYKAAKIAGDRARIKKAKAALNEARITNPAAVEKARE